MFLLFIMLSRLVITFLSRSKHLNFMAAVTICSDFGAPQNRVFHCFHCFPICHEVMGLDAMILVFWMLRFKPTFSISSFTFIKRLFGSSSLSAIRVVSSAYLKVIDISPGSLDSSNGQRTEKGQFSFQFPGQCQRKFKLLIPYSCVHFTC